MTDKQTHFYDLDKDCRFHFERPTNGSALPYILDQRASEQNKKDYSQEYHEYLEYKKAHSKHAEPKPAPHVESKPFFESKPFVESKPLVETKHVSAPFTFKPVK